MRCSHKRVFPHSDPCTSLVNLVPPRRPATADLQQARIRPDTHALEQEIRGMLSEITGVA